MNHRLTQLWATKTQDDEWWSSFVTSPLAIALNYFVVDLKWLTPNKLTLLSFFSAIIATFFIISGGNENFIVAAVLIHLSHIFDCMDGQMARYRQTTSLAGGYYDKLTDELQVAFWFGAIGYAAYSQTQQIEVFILALVGIVAYAFRGYVKYVGVYTKMDDNNNYLSELAQQESATKKAPVAGLGFSLKANLRWFFLEHRKIIYVNEGVFIFMLSLALILNGRVLNGVVFDSLTPMLWIFAFSQVCLAIIRTWSNCREIARIDQENILNKSLENPIESSACHL